MAIRITTLMHGSEGRLPSIRPFQETCGAPTLRRTGCTGYCLYWHYVYTCKLICRWITQDWLRHSRWSISLVGLDLLNSAFDHSDKADNGWICAQTYPDCRLSLDMHWLHHVHFHRGSVAIVGLISARLAFLCCQWYWSGSILFFEVCVDLTSFVYLLSWAWL